MAHPLTHLTHGIPTRRPFHPPRSAGDGGLQSRARLMASSATRWVRWRISHGRVGAHLSVHRMLWVAVGALVASAPGVQAEEGQQRYTSRTTPHVTCVTRHAQNAKPTSRCRTVAPWSTTMRRVFHPETNGVKASPHRHKRVLSHGAPADPSDPWNIHAAPVSPRQNHGYMLSFKVFVESSCLPEPSLCSLDHGQQSPRRAE